MADDAEPIIALSADFETPDETAWRKVVDKALKGAPFERLVETLADGIAVKPLYRAPDAGVVATSTIRGIGQARDPYAPWDIREEIAAADAATLNAEILHALERGAMSVSLRIDPAGKDGTALNDAGAFSEALEDVFLDLATVSLDAGPFGMEAAKALGEAVSLARAETTARIAFNLDPFASAFAEGGFGFTVGEAVAAAQGLAARFSLARTMRIDATPIYEAGGTDAQEIGAALAIGAAYLKAAESLGTPGAAEAVAERITFRLSLGPDVTVSIAKVRALRAAWARVTQAIFGSPSKAHIDAVTAARMMTRRDPWVNLLRTTASAFAGAAAGVDAMTIRPLTDALGTATRFGRRIARNAQIILMEESKLGHVVDPAGGAWAFEALTDDFARAGWAVFQEIEREGGIAQSLTSGALQARAAAARAKLEKSIATRKAPLTGVSEFALLDERPVETGGPLPIPRASGIARSFAPFEPMRLAAQFEALRDRAEASAPKVFCATLGALAEFSARAQFSTNLLAAGGVRLTGADLAHADKDAVAKAFAASGLSVALIAGSDARYAAEAEALAAALKASGATWIVLAGKPGEAEANLRHAGVDQFIFSGQDAIEALNTLHASLGLAP
jgi:methylmalonyl-CoA mutase